MASMREERLAAYPLGRDFMASIRLYIQHWMWRRQLGYLLHPTIPTDQESLHIADVACGTGIWLLDLAKELPASTQLDGFDITTAQFPNPELLPKNVRLVELDALASIADHLQSQYDIVHVGLLVTILRDNPFPLLDNLLLMLKPGGYLQWDEADLGGLYRSSPNQSISHANIDKIYDKIEERLNQDKASFSWARELDKVFLQRNITVLSNRYFPIENDIAQPWTYMHLLFIPELILAIDNPPGSASEWWNVYEKAIAEARDGASIRMGMVSAVGRKRISNPLPLT